MSKIAIITGVLGQDGSNLSDFLLDKGYKVIGITRQTGNPNDCNISHLRNNSNFVLENGNIIDSGSITRLVNKYKPAEFYNLAGHSFVGSSWSEAAETCETNYVGVCNCLEAIRNFSPNTKFLQASTSEIYGGTNHGLLNEDTKADPQSPYASSKYGSESLVNVYRRSYNLFACYTRAFNHEGVRRGKQFVTRKVTSYIGDCYKLIREKHDLYGYKSKQEIFNEAIEEGTIQKLKLGNLESVRDYTDSTDIVRAMWLALQLDRPEDFVLGSGRAIKIREVVNQAFSAIGIEDWSGIVEIDPALFRPAEVDCLRADYSKAKRILNWEPTISFEEMIKNMVRFDLPKDIFIRAE